MRKYNELSFTEQAIMQVVSESASFGNAYNCADGDDFITASALASEGWLVDVGYNDFELSVAGWEAM